MFFQQVYNQSSPTNCTVYCGGFTNGITDELIKKTFSPFGTIQDIRVFKDKGYAFIKFTTKEAATHAIESTHNTEINGSIVKCFWGKENGDPNSVGPNANHQAQQVVVYILMIASRSWSSHYIHHVHLYVFISDLLASILRAFAPLLGLCKLLYLSFVSHIS